MNNIFLIANLTTYIYNDILLICHTKRSEKSRYSGVCGAGMNGNPVMPTKNHRFAHIAIVHIGEHPGRETDSANKIYDNHREIYDNTLCVFR
jgi:hypothetical protein